MAVRITQALKKLTVRDMAYFVEACFFLVIAALLKTFVPIRRYAPLLGELRPNGEVTPVSADYDRLLPIVMAINRAVKYSPFKTRCLSQALCGHLMLWAMRLPSDLYLGVNKDESRDVIAHAWVKSGQYFITGQYGHRKYVAISVFTSRPASAARPSP